jgi:hypothetical protein
MARKTRHPEARRPERHRRTPEEIIEEIDLPQPRKKGPRPKGSEAQANPRQDTLPRSPRKKKGGPSIS